MLKLPFPLRFQNRHDATETIRPGEHLDHHRAVALHLDAVLVRCLVCHHGSRTTPSHSHARSIRHDRPVPDELSFYADGRRTTAMVGVAADFPLRCAANDNSDDIAYRRGRTDSHASVAVAVFQRITTLRKRYNSATWAANSYGSA